MDKVFITVLNMSLTGAFVIAVVCLARLPLKKAPKSISYALWAVAGFRLAFPFSIESVFCLLPFKTQPIPRDIATQAVPRIDSGLPFVNNAIGGILPAAEPAAAANPLQTWITVGAYAWLIGVGVMIIYGIVSFCLLKHQMRNAAQIEGNLYEADNIQSPFVLGIFKPRIYLPAVLSAQERSYIILHEQTHIRRHDHIVKLAAYVILCLHWFNPLAWAAFLLMGVDMEMSCDERVLKEIGGETWKDYSLSLLSLATQRRVIGGSPLAFSEGGLKQRIKNLLGFKKPSRLMMVAAAIFAVVLSVGFAVNRVGQNVSLEPGNVYEFPEERFDGVYFEANDAPYNPEYTVISAQLMNDENIEGLTCGAYFILVKQMGDTWGIVPFTHGTSFDLMAWQLGNGMSFTYTISPEMPEKKLEEGNYRIVTEVWYPTSKAPTLGGEPPPDSPGFYNTAKHTVWADFTIDNNAPAQSAYTFHKPSGPPTKTYTFRDPNGQERPDRLGSIRLYSDGTAVLAIPLFSSFMMPNCVYSFEGDELLIYASVEPEAFEEAFGLTNGAIIARFAVEDETTLVFKSSAVPLYADVGARYVSAPVLGSEETPPPTEEILSPAEIVRQELTNDGCKIINVFLMAQGARKSPINAPYGELAMVYASYTVGEYGDAIYSMRYDFERATTDSPWTHSEPTYWDGIAIDVAAYAARSDYAELTGVPYDDVVVTWAHQIDIEALFPDAARSYYAVFCIGESGETPNYIVLTSPDGVSHWTVMDSTAIAIG